jgi:glycosyltransferase involved in cell wall biosynthesis
MANERVLQHYRSEPVDLLVLLSRSEGLPVSIQEALAHGIPVLATDVGGVAEAVPADADNGILLPAEPALEAVVEALERLWLASADVTAARREGAYRRWAQDFDASRTRGKLAAELAALDFDRT